MNIPNGCILCGRSQDDFEMEFEEGYDTGFKKVIELIEEFYETKNEGLNLSFEESVILESLIDYIKKCR